MRRVVMMLVAAATIFLAGAFAWQANAQTSRGAFNLPAASQNFSPIEKAACGPRPGPYCGPWHTRVCNYGRCWCRPCR